MPEHAMLQLMLCASTCFGLASHRASTDSTSCMRMNSDKSVDVLPVEDVPITRSKV
jgi:hypothetical protein